MCCLKDLLLKYNDKIVKSKEFEEVCHGHTYQNKIGAAMLISEKNIF